MSDKSRRRLRRRLSAALLLLVYRQMPLTRLFLSHISRRLPHRSMSNGCLSCHLRCKCRIRIWNRMMMVMRFVRKQGTAGR